MTKSLIEAARDAERTLTEHLVGSRVTMQRRREVRDNLRSALDANRCICGFAQTVVNAPKYPNADSRNLETLDSLHKQALAIAAESQQPTHATLPNGKTYCLTCGAAEQQPTREDYSPHADKTADLQLAALRQQRDELALCLNSLLMIFVELPAARNYQSVIQEARALLARMK